MYKLIVVASVMGLSQAASTAELSPVAELNAASHQAGSSEMELAVSPPTPPEEVVKPIVNRLVTSEWEECKRLGLLRPFTQKQVEALPADVRLRQANAMKVVMLMRYAINRDNSYRLTKENLEEFRMLAQKLGAPKPFTLACTLEATGNVSARQRYFIRRIISTSLLSYGIKQDRIRVFAEMNKLSALDLKKLIDAEQLPLEQAFEFANLVEDLDAAKVSARIALYVKALQKLTGDIAKVNDFKTADALPSAHLETLPMLQFVTILESGNYKDFRDLMTNEQSQTLAGVVRDLSLQIMRLNEEKFYGSKNLQVFIDLLRL